MPVSNQSARTPAAVIPVVALALAALAACSGSDGTTDEDTVDGRDVVADVPAEADADATDVPPDVAPDLPADVPADLAPDLPIDVPAEVEPDVPVPPAMGFYFGNFHSHTNVSEGEGSPPENYAWARDVAGFDFYAVTDHAEQINDGEWNDLAFQADAANEDGVFVAVRGFEWSHPLIGHSCSFTTAGRTSAFSDLLLDQYYDWVDENDALAQFNHPGREWSNFNDLRLASAVRDNFFAIEVANKGDSIAEGEYLDFFADALDNGWYLAPTSNQDNHEQSTNCHRSVFVGPALTRDGLYEAMRARRIYATDDPNLRLTYLVGDAWMGSRLPAPAGPVVFTVRVEDDEPITSLELITNGGAVAGSTTFSGGETTVSWAPELPVAAGQWYYVKVVGTDTLDGEPPSQTAVSAPIWFD